MAVKFIIDSASDVLPAEAKQLGVTHLPMKVLFGEREYADAVSLSHQEFYEMLASDAEHPTTSQITPGEFAAAYEEVTSQGDTAVVITVSSKLSGTYQSAVIAAHDYRGKVFVVDSLSATIGERLLLQRGLELAKEHLTAEEIACRLDEEKHRVRIFAYVDTLEYLKKGGRISATTAVVGGLLNIKPIITVEDGLVVTAGKARGAKQGNSLLRELALKGNGFDFDRPFALAFSGASDEGLRSFVRDNEDLWQGHEDSLSVATVGCVIGAHAGPGAVALGFFEKE